jgi:uncharacterized protein YecA (UPF0149 family)
MANREKRMVKIFQNSEKPLIAEKLNRNDKCKCGSGKKAKYCCGAETKYYTKK